MNNQLHVVASIGAMSGGEGLAALRYAESIGRAGCAVTLLSKYISRASGSESISIGCLDIRAAPKRKILPFEFFAQYNYIQRLCKQKHIAIIHLHGMWSPFLAVTALVAHRRGLPLVISPHGCLEPWALGYKPHKKTLALKTYQGAILRMASLFVATANQELESIRRLGLCQPIAIIPNGVDVDVTPHRHVVEKTDKTILFLSRVHPIKGLPDLVNAWAIVRRPGWRIVIAGGDEDGYRAKVEALIREKGLQSDFSFLGFVDGDRKQACFDSADIFILPTYSENFGVAIAEALANELPVITTTGAPWQDLITYHSGWWVEPGVQGVADALRAALDCDSDELKHMGQRGRKLVIEKYSWDKIGSVALAVSDWLLDPTLPTPSNVIECGQ